MLFHNYLEELLGSRTKIKILRALNRHKGKEFTIRELANYIKISHTGVHKTLNDLYNMNAVTLKSIGKSHTVALNQESHIADLLDILYGFEEGTLRELQKMIKSKLCNQASIESAAIFGSIARREENPLSDIDLLIVSSDREKAEDTVSELRVEVSRRFGNPISTYIMTREEMDKERPPSLKEIPRRYIMICGKSLE